MKSNVSVIQNGYKDCASACLLSIIKYYGGYYSIEELSLLLKVNKDGTNAYNILKTAKDIGFDGYGIKYSFDDIISNTISFPIIAHIVKDGMYHFVVIYGVDNKKNKLLVMDPSIGNTKYSYSSFSKMYQGTSLVIRPVKKLEKLNNNSSIFKYILSIFKSDINNIIRISVLSLLVVIFSLICSYYLKYIVDYILSNYKYYLLFSISLIYLIIYLFKSIFEFTRNKFLINTNTLLSIKLNNETLKHILFLPYQFFKNKSTGEITSRINDLKNIREIFSNIIINVLVDTLFIIISMIILLSINTNLFLITLKSIIIYFLIVVSYSNKFDKEINSLLESEGEYSKELTETIEGYETIKNINLLLRMNNKLNGKFNTSIFRNKMFENTLNNQTLFKNIVMDISFVLTIFIGTIYIDKGVISLGDFLVFTSILTYFLEPIKNILDLEPNLKYIKCTINRVNDLMIMRSNVIGEESKSIKGDIQIYDLSYSYNGIDNIFENVNLEIKYGSKFLIHGSSGNGKSTIIKLIMKYLSDYKGSIKINRINIKDIDPSIISNSFTYVSQNNYINNDTLKNNIIFNRNISEELYEKIIGICNVDKIRDKKIFRNDFMIEDNGFNISGGERQKIILARALLKDSNFIVLDEALSEVEFVEEKEIMNKIFDYFKDKTIIYISHKEELINSFSNKYQLERS